jgi:hypothetical protein
MTVLTKGRGQFGLELLLFRLRGTSEGILRLTLVMLQSLNENLLLIFTLLVSTVFFSSPSYAGWTKVSINVG